MYKSWQAYVEWGEKKSGGKELYDSTCLMVDLALNIILQCNDVHWQFIKLDRAEIPKRVSISIIRRRASTGTHFPDDPRVMFIIVFVYSISTLRRRWVLTSDLNPPPQHLITSKRRNCDSLG